MILKLTSFSDQAEAESPPSVPFLRERESMYFYRIPIFARTTDEPKTENLISVAYHSRQPSQRTLNGGLICFFKFSAFLFLFKRLVFGF
jgi:hypothetical protein